MLQPLPASAGVGDGGWRAGEHDMGSVRTVGVLGVNVRDLSHVVTQSCQILFLAT